MSSTSELPATGEGQPPSPDHETVPILIVDDQASNLEALESVLAQSGCQLVRAHSADEALLALLDREFAAIVLDIRMPGMSGLELAALIKQRRRMRHVPILLLTAHLLDAHDVVQGYRAGAVDYLTKPVHPEILRQKIASFIELFRKTRALARANAALQREISTRERIQEALEQVNEDLERRVHERTEALRRADRRKDEFLASLAHELRNPLAPIRTAVEVLRLKTTDTDTSSASAVIVRQVEQMTRLIDDLLDVGRITVDKLVLRREAVDLSQVVGAAVETSWPLIAERRHRMSVELPETPVRLHADPARLSQMLSNVISNGANYTAPGGNLQLIASVVDGHVVIRVVDSGIGISREMQPRIFEMFSQGEQSSGLGIGLTLARRLAELHDGSLEVHSDGPGRGAEFAIRLPIANGSVPAHRPIADGDPDAALESHRIMIVDDNQDAADMLAIMLKAWGQEPKTAYDSASALTLAEQFRPDLILLDLGLPDLDGYETARRMRAESWGRDAMLVALTGWGQKADRQRTWEAGFDQHIVKPVPPRVLRAIVNTVPVHRPPVD